MACPLAGSGFRGQEKIGGLRIADARGFERDDNLAVESILSKEAAFWPARRCPPP
jgi:hypothetical protein